MLYRDLTPDDLKEMKIEMITLVEQQLSLTLDSKIREHVESCKECRGRRYDLAKEMIKTMFAKEHLDKSDDWLEMAYKHANIPLPKHCSGESECTCITHEIDPDHCCHCDPNKCVKRSERDSKSWRTVSAMCGICKGMFKTEEELTVHQKNSGHGKIKS